ncbi:hypothetical protein D3C80_1414820 [compost metagenome]
MIEDIACLKPSLIANGVDLPKVNSSLTRSNIRMLASTDKPITNTIPAIPGNVKTAPSDTKIPMMKNKLITNARLATHPALL